MTCDMLSSTRDFAIALYASVCAAILRTRDAGLV